MCTVCARHAHRVRVVRAQCTLVARRRRRKIALRRPPFGACALRVHAHVSVRTDSTESSIIAAQMPKCRHSEAVRAKRSRAARPLGRGGSIARNALARVSAAKQQQTTGSERMEQEPALLSRGCRVVERATCGPCVSSRRGCRRGCRRGSPQVTHCRSNEKVTTKRNNSRVTRRHRYCRASVSVRLPGPTIHLR